MRGQAVWLILAAALAAGCSPSADQKDDSAPIALVNGEAVTAHELRRELALRSKKDPSFRITPDSIREQAEVLVNRRILIQEATERRLHEDERFTATIRTFWEQTLVRLLMERLQQDLKETAYATEEEVRAYYAKLGEKATFQSLTTENEEAAQNAARTAAEGGEVAWQRTIGPVRYDEIRSEALEEAFGFEAGQARVFREGDYFTLVRLVSKEADAPPPLEAIRDQIKARIRQAKERRSFEEWLADERRAARVSFTLENLEKTR
jgi:hypothetical protein